MDKREVEKLLNREGKSKAYLEEMINASPSCLKIVNKEGRLLSMNTRGLKLIEAKDLDSVLGANVYDLLHPEHKEDFIKFNKEVCNGAHKSLRFRIIGLNGTVRWMESFAAPYTLANGENAHIAITNDISDVVYQQQALKEHEHLMKESSKLAELGKLAGNLAHELNNPLMILTGNARKILRTLEKKGNKENSLVHQQEELLEYASKIQETVDRMSKIIKGLKNFSHDSKEIDKKLVSIDSIILEAIALSQEKFKSLGISISFDCDEDLIIHACPVQISQVLINLINNSFDAIKDLENPWIEIQAKRNQDKVEIKVSDSGDGIPSSLQEKMMTPFFTTKQVGQGTGLGLSICSGIINSHGGTFRYNSKSDNTEFIIELPLKTETTLSLMA